MINYQNEVYIRKFSKIYTASFWAQCSFLGYLFLFLTPTPEYAGITGKCLPSVSPKTKGPA